MCSIKNELQSVWGWGWREGGEQIHPLSFPGETKELASLKLFALESYLIFDYVNRGELYYVAHVFWKI